MELNREEIIKALECCQKRKCVHCTYDVFGNPLSNCRVKKQALALIKELTEENERLSKEVADLQDELKCEKETNAHLCSQYMSENHLRHQVEEMLANGMDAVKADTVRKMQKEVSAIVGDFVEMIFDDNKSNCIVPNCNKPDSIGCGNRICIDENKAIWFDMIDQIAKEMLEESK